MAAAGISFLVSLALVPLLVRFAVGRNLLDVPNARSSHEVPTPRLGGLAVIAGVWCAAPFVEGGFAVLVAATLAGLVGVVDDLTGLRFWIKAPAQAAIAFGLLLVLPAPLQQAAGPLGFLALLFGVLWVVALVNAYNFMDGIDGITGGTAVVNALFLGALLGGPALLAALAAASAGFLVWNLSPGRIFLGDSGAYFIGFLLGASALYAHPVPGNSYLSFLVAAAVFTPYLFDTGYTLVRRARAGKNIFSAHREHVYQLITPAPAYHRQVSIIYYALATLAGLAALLAAGGAPLRLLLGVLLVVGCCLIVALLPRVAGKTDA